MIARLAFASKGASSRVVYSRRFRAYIIVASRMKVVILAGGMGTRLAELTEIMPKPMVEIGPRPILWHIMKQYAHFGHTEFYVALGYKGDVIKRYFLDYCRLTGNLTVDLRSGTIRSDGASAENWTLNFVDTGLITLTGGRVKRLQQSLEGATFMVTYGDGVANVDLNKLIDFHRASGRVGTVTAVRPPARFGGLVFEKDRVVRFTEKPQIGEGWINGGFLVFEPQIFKYLDGDQSSLEAHALERLAAEGRLAGYRHEGFWQCMDTMRDKNLLESLWQAGRAPWKVWE